jgi:uncharacterized membrane protein
MRKLLPGLVAVLLAIGFGIWAYPQLPAEVPTHFDINGVPNGWSSRSVAALVIPALGIVLLAVFAVLPSIDPRRTNYAKFGSTYWIVVNSAVVMVAGIQVVVLGKALGWPIDMTRVVGLSLGALLVLLGNLMTRLRPNWFMGIRTPWTLSSDSVWRRTHRFGGIAFVLAGFGVLAATIARSGLALYSAVGFTLAAGLSSVVYSYLVWRGEQGRVDQLAGQEPNAGSNQVP